MHLDFEIAKLERRKNLVDDADAFDVGEHRVALAGHVDILHNRRGRVILLSAHQQGDAHNTALYYIHRHTIYYSQIYPYTIVYSKQDTHW